MDELHLTKKDFRLEWYSGTGAGGQHRNKHQNCCRIIHIDTGFVERGTSHRDRPSNQREAFTKLSDRVIAFYFGKKEVDKQNKEVIRNYHGVRNEVHDKKSGFKQSYKEVVLNGNIGDMIEARKEAMRDDYESN